MRRNFRLGMGRLAVALFVLGGCAANPPRGNQPVEIPVGESRIVGPDGLEVTLRFVSEDSGCLSAKDCSTKLFHGSIGVHKGDKSDLIQAQAILQAGQALTLKLDGYTFLLTDIRRDRQNRHAATFVVPDAAAVPDASQSAGRSKRKEGDAYLAENRIRPGVITTASGLQYEALAQGNGAKPAESDSVEARYTCMHRRHRVRREEDRASGIDLQAARRDQRLDRRTDADAGGLEIPSHRAVGPRLRRASAGIDRAERDADIRGRAARHRAVAPVIDAADRHAPLIGAATAQRS